MSPIIGLKAQGAMYASLLQLRPIRLSDNCCYENHLLSPWLGCGVHDASEYSGSACWILRGPG